MTTSPIIDVKYFSDIFCIWAYINQGRITELIKNKKDNINISYHFMPMFGSVKNKICRKWETMDAYADHVIQLADQFEQVKVHPKIWRENIPNSSASAHLAIKAINILIEKGQLDGARQEKYKGLTKVEEFVWRLRKAFFRDIRNISARNVQFEILEELNIPNQAVVDLLTNGEAMASLFDDFTLKEDFHVIGSPTMVLNEGRQKLYGNVRYNLVKANIEELINNPEMEEYASWC